SVARLKTEIRVAAHIRRATAAGAFATIARKGDVDAGAIAVKIYCGAGKARLLMQAYDAEGEEIWREPFEGLADEKEIDARLEKEARFDSDLWIVEIEDREGRAFLN
ncbi:MAG: DUF1491 family protein, partial [Parvularculaceae bacterium]